MDNSLNGKLARTGYSINNLTFAGDSDRVRDMVRQHAKLHLASIITDKHLVEQRREYHTEFTLEVYVLTPDELHRIIQEATMGQRFY